MNKSFFYMFLVLLSLSAAQGPFKSAFTQLTKAMKSIHNNPYARFQQKGDYTNQFLENEDEITFQEAMKQELAAKKSDELTPEIFMGAFCRVYPKINVLTKSLSFQNESPTTFSSIFSLPTNK